MSPGRFTELNTLAGRTARRIVEANDGAAPGLRIFSEAGDRFRHFLRTLFRL